MASEEARRDWPRTFTTQWGCARQRPDAGHRDWRAWLISRMRAIITQNIEACTSRGCARTGGRSARQRHLCHLPRVRRPLRDRLGARDLREDERLTVCTRCSGIIKTATISSASRCRRPPWSARRGRYGRDLHRWAAPGGLSGGRLSACSPSATARLFVFHRERTADGQRRDPRQWPHHEPRRRRNDHVSLLSSASTRPATASSLASSAGSRASGGVMIATSSARSEPIGQAGARGEGRGASRATSRCALSTFSEQHLDDGLDVDVGVVVVPAVVVGHHRDASRSRARPRARAWPRACWSCR